MSYLDAVTLGLLQGLTEFLPVSSSGHLVLGKAWLGLHTAGSDDPAALSFEIVVH
ncbi:MAG: undecaprenyl-diphosphate phosphatase, partial [Candidatus Zixiibacteriota bacterium]